MIEGRSEIEGRRRASFRPALRSRRPLWGASCCGPAGQTEDLTCLGTVDRMATATADRLHSPTAEDLASLLEPVAVAVDLDAQRVLITERGEAVGYELWFRLGIGRAGGPGWLEFARDPHGSVVTRAVSASEVMALVRDADRDDDVAWLTLSLARWFADARLPQAERIARRLRAEVRAGGEGELVALRSLQARILERLVEGESIGAMCRRGGFLDRRRKPDTTWFGRRSGLMWQYCYRTHKWRLDRTAPPQRVQQLAHAVGVDPHEVGA
jgi:hypothetical protein